MKHLHRWRFVVSGIPRSGSHLRIRRIPMNNNKTILIERKRQGLGKPNLIYVKNFICPVEKVDNHTSSHFLNSENHSSVAVTITIKKLQK